MDDDGGHYPDPNRGDDDAFHFFAHQRAQQQRQRFQARYRQSSWNQHPPNESFGGGGASLRSEAGGFLNADEPKPDEFVPIERIAHSIQKRHLRQTVKHRFRSIAAATALAEGDEDVAAAVAKEDDDDNDEKLISPEVDRLVGGTVVPSAVLSSEMAAASVSSNAMYYSSCSEDEDVLLNTIKLLRHDSPSHAASAAFEEDRPSDPKRARRGDTSTAVPELFQPAPATTHSSAEDSADANANIHEEGSSRRERINRLRVQLVDERRRCGNPAPECFYCMWGNAAYDSANARPVHDLFALMHSEIGRREMRAVAKTVHKYFKDAIYLPMVNAGKRMFMWRTRDIYRHLTEHDCEPRVVIYRTMQELNMLTSSLINETHSVNPRTKQITTHPNNIRAYLDAKKFQWQLMNTNPKKLIYFDERANIDLSAASSTRGANNASGAASVGSYELRAIDSPHAVNVRNK
jgi:hypothetical protein